MRNPFLVLGDMNDHDEMIPFTAEKNGNAWTARLCDALTQANPAAKSNDVGRSLPWLAGDPDGRGEMFDRCQEELPLKAIFHISARTKYIGQ
jgi:hypothetical protein